LSILVTGGAGFIGSHLVSELVRTGRHVVVLDDFTSGRMENLQELVGSQVLRVVNGDIRDKKTLNDAMAGVNEVVHLAAFVDAAESVKKPLFTNDINVSGTVNVLESCSQNGIERFVFASSAAVYGDGNPLPLREEYELRPLSPYAASKVSAEYYCRMFSECYDMNSVVLRFFNVFGPGQGKNSYAGVITKFMQSGFRAENLTIYGDGTQTRDFINVEDVVKAIVNSLSFHLLKTEVFNVCTGSFVSINKLASMMCRVLGKDLKVQHVASRAGDILHSYGDPEKAKRVLRFKADIPFEEGLRQLIKGSTLN